MHHTLLYEFSPVSYQPGLTSPLETFVTEARNEILQARRSLRVPIHCSSRKNVQPSRLASLKGCVNLVHDR